MVNTVKTFWVMLNNLLQKQLVIFGKIKKNSHSQQINSENDSESEEKPIRIPTNIYIIICIITYMTIYI